MKKINHLIPVAACLLLTIRLYAQTPSLKLGVPLINSDYNLDKIVYEDKLSFYMLATSLQMENAKVFLKRFSIKDFTLENDVELSVPDAPGKKLAFEGLQAINDHLYLFSSYYDKEKKSNTLFVNSIDRNGKPDGELKEIDVTTEATRKFHGIYDLQVSKKETKIVTYRQEENFEKEPVKFTLKVFDNTFKLLWKKNVELKYTNEEYTFKSYSVDDNGNACVFAFVKLSTEEKKKYNGDFFKYVLFVFSNEHGSMTEHTIIPPDNSIHFINAKYAVNDKNEIIVAGVYDLENKIKGKMSGSFFFKLDPAKPEPLVYRSTPLSDTFLNSWMQDKKMQRSSLLEDYRCNTVYPTGDGGAMAIYATENGGGHSGPVIIIRYKEDGSVAWEKIILKNQPGGMNNFAFSSQASFYDAKNLYIIYNDNPGNLTTKEAKEIKEVKDFEKESTIVMKSISADGTIENVQLPWKSAEIEKIIFMPLHWYDIKPGLAYIEVWGGHCKSSANGKSASKCKMVGRISTITE